MAKENKPVQVVAFSTVDRRMSGWVAANLDDRAPHNAGVFGVSEAAAEM